MIYWQRMGLYNSKLILKVFWLSLSWSVAQSFMLYKAGSSLIALIVDGAELSQGAECAEIKALLGAD